MFPNDNNRSIGLRVVDGELHISVMLRQSHYHPWLSERVIMSIERLQKWVEIIKEEK